MEKEQIISFIKTHLDDGQITREDLAAIARGDTEHQKGPDTIANELQKTPSWNIINTLYVIGSIIGIAGVTILAQQHWDAIGFGGRIGVTLGLSFVTYVTALLICKSPQQMISQVMFVISAILAPIGTYILLNQLQVQFIPINQAITALSLFIIFIFAQYIARTNVLVIVLTAFGTWAYFALLQFAFLLSYFDSGIFKWATIVLGIGYILIAYGFSGKHLREGIQTGEEHSVANILYGLGTLAVLGAGITLGGIWDLIFLLFVFFGFYGSVIVRSQMMLILSGIFLIADVLKITYRYFLGSLGWPIALIVCGFLIIAIGYLTFELNQRYLSKKK